MGLRCVYPNSGAFEFADPARRQILGFALRADATVRPELRSSLHTVEPSTPRRLAEILVSQWQAHMPTADGWLLPASHWGHELHHGNGAWLGPMLKRLQVDVPAEAAAPAVAFRPARHALLLEVAEAMFARLQESDVTVLFPPFPVIATLHHHRQLWWRAEATMISRLL